MKIFNQITSAIAASHLYHPIKSLALPLAYISIGIAIGTKAIPISSNSSIQDQEIPKGIPEAIDPHIRT